MKNFRELFEHCTVFIIAEASIRSKRAKDTFLNPPNKNDPSLFFLISHLICFFPDEYVLLTSDFQAICYVINTYYKNLSRKSASTGC
jgi:hypothetical protein